MIAWYSGREPRPTRTARQAPLTSSPVLVLDVSGNTVRPKYLTETIRFTHLAVPARYVHLLTSTLSKVSQDATHQSRLKHPRSSYLSSKGYPGIPPGADRAQAAVKGVRSTSAIVSTRTPA